MGVVATPSLLGFGFSRILIMVSSRAVFGRVLRGGGLVGGGLKGEEGIVLDMAAGRNF